jgi:salicylate hydroxylase
MSTTTTTVTQTQQQQQQQQQQEQRYHPVVITGAGIVGLTLALALEKHAGIKPLVVDQASSFNDGVGAGIGMYPNGLRVIKDISPMLLARIQHAGVPYRQRRWERHDGSTVMSADESVISDDSYAYNLEPMGVRRWKLQKILYEAVVKKGITVEFDKQVLTVQQQQQQQQQPLIRIEFQDGTSMVTELVLAADGAKSAVREAIMKQQQQQTPSKLTLTGTTCMYGVATLPYEIPSGLALPSSETTKCHGAFYATDVHEQCFQFHMPTPHWEGKERRSERRSSNAHDDNDDDNNDESTTSGGAASILHAIWDPLSSELCQEECEGLANVLAEDGWDEAKYLQPLRHATKAIKVPFALLEPPLQTFVYQHNRVVLVGDSAHPPVPYLGQGAQQGIEDAGTLALLMKGMDVVSSSSSSFFDTTNLDRALRIYDRLRVPRTQQILELSKEHGTMQQKRAESANRRQSRAREEQLQRNVFFHETLNDVLPGATYDYKEAVNHALKAEPLGVVIEKEEEEETEKGDDLTT